MFKGERGEWKLVFYLSIKSFKRQRYDRNMVQMEHELLILFWTPSLLREPELVKRILSITNHEWSYNKSEAFTVTSRWP